MKNKIETYFVESSTKIEANEVVSLSKVQKIICNIFKISPEKKYKYIFNIKITETNRLMVGSCITSADGSKWIIININNHFYEITNLTPMLFCNGIYGEIALLYTLYFENIKI